MHHGGLGGAGVLAELLLADGLDKVARVDLDWALDLAHAVRRACLLSLVRVDAGHLLQPAQHKQNVKGGTVMFTAITVLTLKF